VWILVIHYAFSDGKSGKRRSGNAQDVELLQNLFGEYQDCTFREIASPPSNDIAKILSKDGIASRFENRREGTKKFIIYVAIKNIFTSPWSTLWHFLTSGGERGPKNTLSGENPIPLSKLEDEISLSIAETSTSFFRKSTLWVLVFSTSKAVFLSALSTQFFSKSFIGHGQRT
jgi:hypothetical protein